MRKNKTIEEILADSLFNPNEEPDFKGHFCEGIKKEEIFGKWKVDLLGNMIYDNGRYFIEADCLSENDLLLQMDGKEWITWNEFMPAYLQALTNAGCKEIRQKI